MTFLSADRIRAYIDNQVGIRTNTIPPNQQLHAALTEMQRLAADKAEAETTGKWDKFLSRLDALHARDKGLALGILHLLASPPGQIAPQRPKPYVTTAAQRQALKALQNSAGVSTFVTAMPFWQRVVTIGEAYDAAAGLGPSSMTLNVQTAAGPLDWGVTLDRFSRTAHEDSVATLIPRQQQAGTPSPSQALEIWAASDYPQLFMAVQMGLLSDPGKYKHLCDLIDAVSTICALLIQQLKHQLQVPRPKDVNPGVLLYPDLPPVPLYTAFPAGHAAFCAALAVVLCAISGADAGQAKALGDTALGIVDRREWIGFHCPLESEAGRTLGTAIGEMLVQAAEATDVFPGWSALFGHAAQSWS